MDTLPVLQPREPGRDADIAAAGEVDVILVDATKES